MRTRKSWRAKMDNPNLPKVIAIPSKMQKRCGTGMMVLPSAHDVNAFVSEIPEGGLTTVSRIRQAMAEKYMVTTACPLVTGIMMWIVAEAADERARAGEPGITPYWRVVKDDGSLNPKFPGGVERQEEMLRDEGHRIVAGRGKRVPRVALSELQ
jgi:hypothetical protein